MSQDSNEIELQAALRELGLSPGQAEFCNQELAADVVRHTSGAFLKAPNQRWWWASLKVPRSVFACPEGDGYLHLLEHVPPGESRCWLIVENDLDGPWHVLDVDIAIVPQIVAECYPFEYYLVGKRFDWLVAENHHNEIIVAAASAE